MRAVFKVIGEMQGAMVNTLFFGVETCNILGKGQTELCNGLYF